MVFEADLSIGEDDAAAREHARAWGCCFCGCSGELRDCFMPERPPWVTSPPALMMVTSDKL